MTRKHPSDDSPDSYSEGTIVVHPSAIVHSRALLEPGVVVGPFCIVGEHVKIGVGTRLISHVVVDGHTTIGAGNTIYPFTTIGMVPQDLKYQGEPARTVIGSGNTIRESVTIHRGTQGGGMETTLGDNNLLMAYCHVAHDCRIGSRIIMANSANLAGHITIEDGAIIGGLSGIHQFVRIGRYALVGGMSGVPKDVPPFVWASGNRAFLYGLNHEGLRRNHIGPESVSLLKKAYQILFRSGLPMTEALGKVRSTLSMTPEIDHLLTFVEQSERGVLTAPKEQGAAPDAP
jgi:UDP-N-acetylglucosamine acyltransferase